jgi:ribosomal protein L32
MGCLNRAQDGKTSNMHRGQRRHTNAKRKSASNDARGGQTCFELERSSAVVEFTPQNGTFAGPTVALTLGALIRLHHLCTARLVSTDHFLTLKFDSQFHDLIQSILGERSRTS